MSRAIMISVSPIELQKILSGEKSLLPQVRRPSIKPPFKCLIYCKKLEDSTVSSKQPYYLKVVAEFICDEIKCANIPYPATQNDFDSPLITNSGTTYKQLRERFGDDEVYFMHMSNLTIYDKPKLFIPCDTSKE